MTISILLVDDSEVIRFLFTKSLERDPDLRVVATASNGIEAIEMAKKHQPNVVLLDISMPHMDGMTALPLVLQASPKSVVIVVSGDTRENAEAAIDSLGLGAAEFILKPGATGAMKAQDFNDELRLKVKALAGGGTLKSTAMAAPRPPVQNTQAPEELAKPAPAEPLKKLSPMTGPALPREKTAAAAPATPAKPSPYKLVPPTSVVIKAVALASSTGGPEALMRIFEGLRGELNHLPIFITQHMPSTFTAAMAEHLTRAGERKCLEAAEGMVAEPGVAYLARGGYHMILRAEGKKTVINLTQDPPVNSCRPAADPMFASLCAIYGANLLACVLTGIGHDGMLGAKTISHAGGSVIAQDKETSVVYGMPKAVAEIGVCEAILPIGDIAAYIKRRCWSLQPTR